jgi:carbon storage regulator CsrA
LEEPLNGEWLLPYFSERRPLMLVLSRHLGEKIVLPSLDVTIQVVAVKSGVVRIGIDAPPEVAIVREELLEPSPVSAVPPQCSLQPCNA